MSGLERWLSWWSACHTSMKTWVQTPSTHIKAGTVAWIWNPLVLGGTETDRFLELIGQLPYSKWQAPGSVTDDCQPLPMHTHTHARTHSYEHICTPYKHTKVFHAIQVLMFLLNLFFSFCYPLRWVIGLPLWKGNLVSNRTDTVKAQSITVNRKLP